MHSSILHSVSSYTLIVTATIGPVQKYCSIVIKGFILWKQQSDNISLDWKIETIKDSITEMAFEESPQCVFLCVR